MARIAVDAVGLDDRLPAWLDRAGPAMQTYRPVMDVAIWTTSSRLGAVARELAAAGRNHIGLDELDIARSPMRPAPAVTTIDAAIAAVRTGRTWLWQHPDQVTGAHLQLGTQLGLAVHILAAGGDAEVTGGWRQAAIAAADLRATPPVGAAQDAAGELGEALRWVRSLLNTPDRLGQEPEMALGRLEGELPPLAASLDQGLRSAVRRGDLFVRGEAVLQRPAGSLVYRAVAGWRLATAEDDLVRDISRALSQKRGASAASVAAKAFPRPTRPGPLVKDNHTLRAPRPRPGRTPGLSR